MKKMTNRLALAVMLGGLGIDAFAQPRGEEGFLDLAPVQLVVEVHAFRDLQFHVVQDDRLLLVFRARDVDIEGPLADHAEAEVFEKRHAARERQMISGMEDLQVKQRPMLTSHLMDFQ